MDTSNYQGIIFDLDGTLLDTLTDLADATNRVLTCHGFATHPVGAYRYFVGDGMRMLVERALPPEQRVAEVVDQVFSELHADYGENWAVATRPYAGVVELLAGLQQRGIVMSVLSNKPDEFTGVMVRTYFPDIPFKCIYGLSDRVAKKPDPSGALRIAAETGIKPAQTLYLGDTLVDMKTAVSAGMFPIGALWGFRDEPELRAGGAELLLQHPLQLLA
ncbi:MAG TPA: HAD family hydrolase [Candidatus Rifleibacterium sp.]|jgi:phosphoglycolate phosphatase|nr:HAD family hydrolase [Candidatus Rifleibacterium sp.]